MCVCVYILGITFFDVTHSVQENYTWIGYARDKAVAG